MFDCHVHSFFSGDCDTPAEDSCNKAIESGLLGLAFTDHLDYDYPDFDEKFLINFDEYSEYMDSLKDKYKGKLTVLKGIEVGIQPQVIEKTLSVTHAYDFDFVINSIHIIDRVDPYTGKYFTGKDKITAFTRYLEEIYNGIRSFDDFDVVGHIGYIRRYCDYDDRSLCHKDYPELIDSILKLVIDKNKGIEVNTSGYRSGFDSPMPDFDIVKRYKELGGEIITIGSDAHFAQHVGYNFKVVREMLGTIGFEYLAHFEQRVPIFERIV